MQGAKRSLQSYILDRLSSTFTFKYDRASSKLSDAAIKGLSGNAPAKLSPSMETMASALGLELTGSSQAVSDSDDRSEPKPLAPNQEDQGLDDDDDDSFVRQLELGLEEFATDEAGKDSSMEEKDSPPEQIQAKTGLGITRGTNHLRDSIITPRGSPYIDRPKEQLDTPKPPIKGLMSSQFASTNTARSTPVVSPPSLVNSPRISGIDSVLTSSSSWKPPPQRSNVAIAYDEDDEEGDDESDDDDEDGEDDEEDDDDDFDSFARQLESSLQG
jgi:hypothetical protein